MTNQLTQLRFVTVQRIPVDRIKDVVKKMGIDLCLERLQFCALFQILCPADFVDQLLDLFGHGIQTDGRAVSSSVPTSGRRMERCSLSMRSTV